MAPRSTPPPRASFAPPNDTATYRDLLMFEERLKTNAANLQRRKSRYQFFLVQLLAIIAFLLSEVFLPPSSSILVLPYRWTLQRLLPQIYTREAAREVGLHPYVASGLLFISVTTLVLFFASGMYAEKIDYANKYVPHANRALRSFNMYLNVRKPFLRSKAVRNPLAFFFPRPEEYDRPATRMTSAISSSSASRFRSPSPSASSPTSSHSHSQRSTSPLGPRERDPNTSVPIPPIPPAINPRGELIFSSRVDRNFREAYERYRAAFERKRAEKEREGRVRRWWWRAWYWWNPLPESSAALLSGGGGGVARSVSGTGVGAGAGTGTTSRSGTPPVAAFVGRNGSPMRTPGTRSSSRSGSPATTAGGGGGRVTPVGAGGAGGGGGGGGRPGSARPGSAGLRPTTMREPSGESVYADMRTMALERSLVQDQLWGR